MRDYTDQALKIKKVTFCGIVLMFELLLSGHVVYRFHHISLRKPKDEECARWRDEQINFAKHMLRV